MYIRNVNFPQEIIEAQKSGELVIFAGAGVSMDPHSNYPDFDRLGQAIGGSAHPRRDREPIDRYLGRLVEENIPVHDRVRQILSSPDSKPNHLHKSLVSLFGQPDRIRESTWNRWLSKYWQRRTQSNPLPLDPQEAGEMVGWAFVLKSHFAEAVEFVRKGSPPTFGRSMIYYQLDDAKIAKEQPIATAKLLAVLLLKEDGKELWDLDQLHLIVDQLIQSVPEEPTLQGICEELGRIGSARALEFRSRLEIPRKADV